jgi:hypothetical protein
MAVYLAYKVEADQVATEDDVAVVLDNFQGMKDVAFPVDASFASEPSALDDAGAETSDDLVDSSLFAQEEERSTIPRQGGLLTDANFVRLDDYALLKQRQQQRRPLRAHLILYWLDCYR